MEMKARSPATGTLKADPARPRQAFEASNVNHHSAYSAASRVAPPHLIWGKRLTAAIILLGLSVLVAAIVLPLNLVPALAARTTAASTTITTAVETIAATTLTTAAMTTSTITPLNQTNSTAHYCSGTAPWTRWTFYAPDAITMNINTTQCNFNQVPLYFTSITGWGTQFVLASYNAIYAQTRTSFTVYARSLINSTGTRMLNESQVYQWNMIWFGNLN